VTTMAVNADTASICAAHAPLMGRWLVPPLSSSSTLTSRSPTAAPAATCWRRRSWNVWWCFSNWLMLVPEKVMVNATMNTSGLNVVDPTFCASGRATRVTIRQIRRAGAANIGTMPGEWGFAIVARKRVSMGSLMPACCALKHTTGMEVEGARGPTCTHTAVAGHFHLLMSVVSSPCSARRVEPAHQPTPWLSWPLGPTRDHPKKSDAQAAPLGRSHL
jgi:hypothetical protein